MNYQFREWINVCPYLYTDASYFKVRDGVTYSNKPFLVVGGIRTDGYREYIGRIWRSEVSPRWISSNQTIIPESCPRLEKCSWAPGGRCVKFISFWPFSERSPGKIPFWGIFKLILERERSVLFNKKYQIGFVLWMRCLYTKWRIFLTESIFVFCQNYLSVWTTFYIIPIFLQVVI